MDERDAAERVAARLAEIGYAAGVEEFAARVSPDAWLVAYVGLSAAAALVLYALPLVAAVAGTAAILLHARDTDGRPLWKRTARAGSMAVARSPDSGRPDLVVVAPLCSSAPRFGERTQRALVVSLLTLMTAIAAGGAAAWIAEVEAELPRTVVVAGLGAALAVGGLGVTLYRSDSSSEPAANEPLDVLFDLAPSLRGRRVWFVATEAEGMQAFLEAHAGDVAGAAWLNLGAAPSGDVVAVSEEGTWRERRADRRLMGAAEEAGAEVRPYRAAPTNAAPLLARRRRALTLLVGSAAEGTRVARATALAALAERSPPR